MSQAIFQGMVQELCERGKCVETLGGEQSMTSRWVKQLLHRELDVAREAWLGGAGEAPVDLDIDFDMAEAQQQSRTAESEQEAAKLLARLGPLAAPAPPVAEGDVAPEPAGDGDWRDH